DLIRLPCSDKLRQDLAYAAIDLFDRGEFALVLKRNSKRATGRRLPEVVADLLACAHHNPRQGGSVSRDLGRNADGGSTPFCGHCSEPLIKNTRKTVNMVST